ncbi:MAG: transglycosylase SLT domain-containing protein [Campylobacteraceae bacterium]|nr:transglycosylase SLT domain-containing protein [Campylobacteraceae bacterium]
MRVIYLILFSTMLLKASNAEIANAINSVAAKSGLDRSIYYTIISVETGFKPYSIGLIADTKMVKRLENLKEFFEIKKSSYGKKYLVSIHTTNEENIIKLAEALYPMNMNFDAGLMQISKQHLTKEELKKIFNPEYNIAKGSNILFDCAKRFKETHKAIECYNKGYQISSFNYYSKFLSHYRRHFGDTNI